MLHDLLQGETLERARAAWLRAEPAYRAEFEAAAAAGTSAGAAAGGHGGDVGNNFVYGIPNLLELDDVFIDLADHPKLVDVMQHVAGAGGLDDGMRGKRLLFRETSFSHHVCPEPVLVK